MNLDQTYQNILKEINLGHRGLVKLSQDDLDELALLLETSDAVMLEKVLCVVEHSSSFSHKLEPSLLKVLSSPFSDALLIFALNC
jgi:hypothetical protein